MGQVIEKCTIGAGQAKIIKLTITLNNCITLEDQLIELFPPFTKI